MRELEDDVILRAFSVVTDLRLLLNQMCSRELVVMKSLSNAEIVSGNVNGVHYNCQHSDSLEQPKEEMMLL